MLHQCGCLQPPLLRKLGMGLDSGLEPLNVPPQVLATLSGYLGEGQGQKCGPSCLHV